MGGLKNEILKNIWTKLLIFIELDSIKRNISLIDSFIFVE
jgi:hypothetical protein